MGKLALLLALVALPQGALAFSGGAPTYSGGPGSSGSCNSCHDANVGAPTLAITGPTSLSGGATGSYTLTISGGPAVRGGWTIAIDKGTINTSQPSAFVYQNEVLQRAATNFAGGALTVAFTVTAPAAAGTLRISAAGNSANGNGGSSGDKGGVTSLNVTISAGNAAPTVATAAAANPGTVTGATTALSVLGADDGGEANLTYTWGATGPATVTFSANGNNAAKSSTATFTQAGSYNFTVTIADAAGRSVTSTRAVTVNAAIATITVTATGNQVPVGQTKQYTAQGKDQFGANVAATFTWSASGGGTINASGLYTAGGTAGGPHTITAASGGRTGTANVTVVAANAPTVATAPAANPSPVTGQSANLTVLGADDGGEGMLTYTWSAPTAPAAVTFSANGTNAAKASTATFTRAGAYVLSVRIVDGAGLATTANLNLTVNAALATVAVSPATISVALNGTQAFTAQGKDQFGQVMSPQPSFSWTVSGGGTVNASGTFTAGNTAGGPHTLTATSGSRTGTATINLTSGSPPTVANAAAASQSPVTGVTVDLTVLGADDGSESSLTYLWSGTGPAAVTFSANDTNAAKATTATFSRAGNYALSVLIKDAVGLSATSTVNVAVDQTFTALTVTPATVTVAPNGQQPFAGAAEDQFGRPMNPQPVMTWNLVGNGAVSPSGLYTAPSAAGGPYSLIASSGGRTGLASVTVASVAPPTVMQPAAANPAMVTAKQSQLTVVATDSAGESNLRYKWEMMAGDAAVTFSPNDSNSAKTTIVKFAKVGIYSLRVTISNTAGLMSTSDVEVTVESTFTTLRVAPMSVTVATGGTQTFTAAAEDQFGDELLALTPPTWSVSNGGTIDQSGVFTAQTMAGGPFSVTASSGALTGLATVLVSDSNDHTPPALTIAGIEKDQAVGQVVDLTANVEDTSPITLVSFIVDEQVVTTMSAGPYVWGFDTRDLADGPHRLSVMAKDLAGNASRTAPMTFFVDNTLPTVRWLSPTVGTEVANELLVKLDVGDNLGAKSVRIIVDDAEFALLENDVWETRLDISGLSNGPHWVDAVAMDKAGNENTARIKIEVQNTLPEAQGGFGCNAGGAAPAVLALFALFGMLRRRK